MLLFANLSMQCKRPSASSEDNRPIMFLILVDDPGYGVTGAYGLMQK